jgi:SAM-dependent methyltransferase
MFRWTKPRLTGLGSKTDALGTSAHATNLFVVGFLVLFFELACIRWFATSVVFLQFFTNVILISCFLGMSCGCLAARHSRDWLAVLPYLALAAVTAALATLALYNWWGGLVVDVGSQRSSPQQIFFGTEYRNPDVAQFVVPIELVAAVFFILIALPFLGLGQTLGRAFDAYPHRVVAYTLNIAGSLAGISAFSVLSFLQTPPSIWFLISGAGIGYLMLKSGSLNWPRAFALVALPVMVAAPSAYRGQELRWSPYYAVEHDRATGNITVNGIGHQAMVPFEKGGASYSLIHLLRRHAGGRPFQDVLVIGAGSGNDVAHALRQGAERVDALEIDPVIQDIGVRYHPDRPYQDPRVFRHIDDGRHFLRTTERKYDLVVYALVDSLILHSGYSNVRLESFLFTEEALADIERVLKPNGVFVTYNYFRRGWIVERVAAMAERVFGCKPVVLSMPQIEKLASDSPSGFTMVIADCSQGIGQAFDRHGTFWLHTTPPENLGANGFAIQHGGTLDTEREDWTRIAPTSLLFDRGTSLRVRDDWPFLYLRDRLIPDLNIRSIALLGTLGVAMVYLFLPRGRARIDTRMFLLGAGFMLMETKAVVQLALLFGSTWLVNSVVFFAVLVLILLANVYVLKAPHLRLARHYAGLLALLGIAGLVPLETFLSGSIVWRYIIPCVLALGPMFFAGVIFAQSFKQAAEPDVAFGSNIAGSVVGGLGEALSMLIGFQYLLLVAAALYAMSAWPAAARPRPGWSL